MPFFLPSGSYSVSYNPIPLELTEQNVQLNLEELDWIKYPKHYKIHFCQLLGLSAGAQGHEYLPHADLSAVLGCCLSPAFLQCVRCPRRGCLEEKVTRKSVFYLCICHIVEERSIFHVVEERQANQPIYYFYLLDGYDYMTPFGINYLDSNHIHVLVNFTWAGIDFFTSHLSQVQKSDSVPESGMYLQIKTATNCSARCLSSVYNWRR